MQYECPDSGRKPTHECPRCRRWQCVPPPRSRGVPAQEQRHASTGREPWPMPRKADRPDAHRSTMPTMLRVVRLPELGEWLLHHPMAPLDVRGAQLHVSPAATAALGLLEGRVEGERRAAATIACARWKRTRA
eukprot:2871097-Prymnesium_polylepis.2